MSFPSVSPLDSMEGRTENPLNNSGKWKKLFTQASTGFVEANEWRVKFQSDKEGAYWATQEFTRPFAVALKRSSHIFDTGSWCLWGSVSNPELSTISGYRLCTVFEEAATFQDAYFTFKIEKCSGGSFTVLNTVTKVILAVGDRIGLTVEKGGGINSLVTGWKKSGAGSWTEALSVLNSSGLASGLVGFETINAKHGNLNNVESNFGAKRQQIEASLSSGGALLATPRLGPKPNQTQLIIC